MNAIINTLDISVRHLPKTADREDFSVRVQQAGNDYSFRLSLTGTVVAIWGADPDQAVCRLLDRLIQSHGTSAAFDQEGFWFDGNNSSNTVDRTLNDIENKGWRAFVHPSIRTTLGAQLFGLLDQLDEAFTSRRGRSFVRSLDVLGERSQAGDDFESAAPDRPHFLYRVCLAASIVDRFDFTSPQGSLNGLRGYLVGEVGEAEAARLTESFYKLRRLRNQYPVHEEFEVGGEGIRRRRAQLEDAESYFGLTGETGPDWVRVRSAFVAGLERLLEAVAPAPSEER